MKYINKLLIVIIVLLLISICVVFSLYLNMKKEAEYNLNGWTLTSQRLLEVQEELNKYYDEEK